MSPRGRVRRVLAAGMGLALLLTVFLDVAMLVVPVYDMQLYDRVLQSRNMDTLAVLSVACGVGLLMFGLLDYLRGACFVTIGEAVDRQLRSLVLRESVRRVAAGEHRSGPELIRDLDAVQGFLASGAPAVPLDALCAPMFLAVLFMLHPVFGWLGIVGITLVTLVGLMAEKWVRPLLLAAQERRTRAAQSLARNLASPELVEGMGMLAAVVGVWGARYGRAQAELDRANSLSLVLAGSSRVVRLGLQAAGMTCGALMVVAGAVTPGSLMGANLLLNKVPAPFDHLVGTWRQWALAYAAWRRIDRMLAEIMDFHPIGPMNQPPCGLRVEGVSLRIAEDRVLLRDIDLDIAPGTLLAIVGPNGAGKSTLLRLVAGLLPPTAGRVTLDGVSVYGGPGVGYLPPSVSLLDGGVAENIGRFQDGALDEVVAAARLAETHNAIGRMARGYDTVLSMNGATLSGGLRQRIGLARAVHGSPRLLVLDEPDANLDREGSDALLRALLACRARGAIVLVTSHRAALRNAADRVVTLRDGAIVDFGASPSPVASAVLPLHLATA